jgi:hypothetical protein
MNWRPFDFARDVVVSNARYWKRGLLVRRRGLSEVFLIGDANERGGTCVCCDTVPVPGAYDNDDDGGASYEVCDELLLTVETLMGKE